MMLMPQGSFRWCVHCGFRWFTAHPQAQLCPKCGTEAADTSGNWPHVCGRGHGSTQGGECQECGK